MMHEKVAILQNPCEALYPSLLKAPRMKGSKNKHQQLAWLKLTCYKRSFSEEIPLVVGQHVQGNGQPLLGGG